VVAVVVVVLDAALLGAAPSSVLPAAPPAIDARTATTAKPLFRMVICSPHCFGFPPLGGSYREAAGRR
jgi:hypothetical protein